jgi:hypothetical protein
MSILSMGIKYTGPVPGSSNMRQSQFNQIVRDAWIEVAHFWHEHILPKHFTEEGGREYGYMARKGDQVSGKAFNSTYQGKKLKKWGHQKPLVWSGELEQKSHVAGITATATSSGSQCKTTLPNCQKANWKNPNTKIDMPDELTRFSEADREIIVRMFNARLDAKFETLEYAREVSVYSDISDTLA